MVTASDHSYGTGIRYIPNVPSHAARCCIKQIAPPSGPTNPLGTREDGMGLHITSGTSG